MYGVDMTTAHCDKYGFKAMQVGDFRFVTGVEPKHAQMAFYKHKIRHQHLRNRQFLWWAVNGGIKVERVG